MVIIYKGELMEIRELKKGFNDNQKIIDELWRSL